jgi:glycerol-3-phosphate dehydrogenase (NAD+)
LASFPGAIAKIIARNCQRRADFQKRVEMWVHEEEVEGRKLTEIINSDHENVKYLPGVALPPNLLLDEFDS